MLWVEENPVAKSLNGYAVYRSDKHDRTYMSDYYSMNSAKDPENSYALTLLTSKNPISKLNTLKFIANQV